MGNTPSEQPGSGKEGCFVFKRGATTTADQMEHPASTVPRGAVIDGAGQSILFTLVGAAALIVSAFLEWIRPEGVRGTEIGYRAFYRTTVLTDTTFLRSAGFVAIGVGLLAILGL